MTAAPRFATRLNAFAAGGRAAPAELLARAAAVPGLTDVDLNFPDHFAGTGPRALAARAREAGLAVNGLAMRYYGDPAFRRGAFTHPDPAVRRRALDLTKRGMDAAREAGAGLLTLWLGQDGRDAAFGADPAALWALEVAGLAEVAAHDPGLDVAVEYKPDEPRAMAVLRDAATTLLAIREAGAPNLGVTIDFAHSLYAGESPAAAAALVLRFSRLLGLHLNDGHGRRDDGLPVGSVHPLETVELLRVALRAGYARAFYFDTFPEAAGLDPAAECAANIAATRHFLAVAAALEASNALREAEAAQDALAAQAILRAALGARP